MQCAMISWPWKATSIPTRYEMFVFSVDGAYTTRKLNWQIFVQVTMWDFYSKCTVHATESFV